MVQDTDIVELELKSARFSLALRKKEALEVAEPTVIYQVRSCFLLGPAVEDLVTHEFRLCPRESWPVCVGASTNL